MMESEINSFEKSIDSPTSLNSVQSKDFQDTDSLNHSTENSPDILKTKPRVIIVHFKPDLVHNLRDVYSRPLRPKPSSSNRPISLPTELSLSDCEFNDSIFVKRPCDQIADQFCFLCGLHIYGDKLREGKMFDKKRRNAFKEIFGIMPNLRPDYVGKACCLQCDQKLRNSYKDKQAFPFQPAEWIAPRRDHSNCWICQLRYCESINQREYTDDYSIALPYQYEERIRPIDQETEYYKRTIIDSAVKCDVKVNEKFIDYLLKRLL